MFTQNIQNKITLMMNNSYTHIKYNYWNNLSSVF